MSATEEQTKPRIPRKARKARAAAKRARLRRDLLSVMKKTLELGGDFRDATHAGDLFLDAAVTKAPQEKQMYLGVAKALTAEMNALFVKAIERLED